MAGGVEGARLTGPTAVPSKASNAAISSGTNLSDSLPQEPLVHTALGHRVQVVLVPFGVGVRERIAALSPELLC